MGGNNPPKPVPCTAHKFAGEIDETVDLELSIKVFLAQKEFSEFLIEIDRSLLEERRNNVDVATHRMLTSAEHLASSVDEIGNAVMMLDIYMQSLDNLRTPDKFKKLLTEEIAHRNIVGKNANSGISEIIRENGYASGLSSIRDQLIVILDQLKVLGKDTSFLINDSKNGNAEKSLSNGDSDLRKHCHQAAQQWSQLLLDWSAVCSIGNEAYRLFYLTSKLPHVEENLTIASSRAG